MTTHTMLDLETFGTGPDAAIVQIGACRFDIASDAEPEPRDRFEATISLQSSLLAGGSVDADTIAWWRKQAPEARAAITGRSGMLALEVALRSFAVWYQAGSPLWAYGANFDPPVLESAYRSLGIAVPWSYRDVRCVRTLLKLAEESGWQREDRRTAHTALADAIAQVRDAHSAWRQLRDQPIVGLPCDAPDCSRRVVEATVIIKPGDMA